MMSVIVNDDNEVTGIARSLAAAIATWTTLLTIASLTNGSACLGSVQTTLGSDDVQQAVAEVIGTGQKRLVTCACTQTAPLI